MQAIAYIPTVNHEEPTGTDKKVIIKDLKTYTGVIRRAVKVLGGNIVIKRFASPYDESSYHTIYRGNMCNCEKCFS